MIHLDKGEFEGQRLLSAPITRRSASLRRVACQFGYRRCRTRGSQEAGCRSRGVEFAPDSPLEEAGFELVWGFSCQVVVLGFAESSLFGAGKPFFIPSPAIRFPERAEGVKGPKR